MGNDVGVTSHILEEEENDGEEEDNTTNMTSVKLNANNGEEEVEPQQYEVSRRTFHDAMTTTFFATNVTFFVVLIVMFQVEQILKSRLVKGKTEYLVRQLHFRSVCILPLGALEGLSIVRGHLGTGGEPRSELRGPHQRPQE